MRKTALLLSALATLAAGCLPERLSGHFGAEAYYHTRDHYRVRYGDVSPELLAAPWELGNFERDEDGRPGRHLDDEARTSTYDLVRYARTRGRPMLRVARYDLYFQSAQTGSVIFARTIPLRDPWTRDPLPVLMRRSVASLAAFEADGPDLLGRPVAAGGARVRMNQEGPARVDGREAHVVRFELQSLGPDGAMRAEEVTLVGLLPPRPLAVRRGVELPTLLVFGLVSTPSAHTGDRDALASLVRRVDLAAR